MHADTAHHPAYLKRICWGKAIQAGLISGAIFYFVSGVNPWMDSLLLRPAIMGREIPGVTPDWSTLTLVGLAHLALSVFYALIIVTVIHRFRIKMAELASTIIGLVLYALNFLVFTQIAGGFTPAAEWKAALTHLASAWVIAGAYRGLLRRSEADPSLVD